MLCCKLLAEEALEVVRAAVEVASDLATASESVVELAGAVDDVEDEVEGKLLL